jgi:hypothetical protein
LSQFVWFGIERGTASAAIEVLQLLPNAIKFEMTVCSVQQVLGGDVIINAEEIKKSCLASHHRPIHRKSMRGLDHDSMVATTLSFSTVSVLTRSVGPSSLCFKQKNDARREQDCTIERV